jgi:hypothetical protein
LIKWIYRVQTAEDTEGPFSAGRSRFSNKLSKICAIVTSCKFQYIQPYVFPHFPIKKAGGRPRAVTAMKTVIIIISGVKNCTSGIFCFFFKNFQKTMFSPPGAGLIHHFK